MAYKQAAWEQKFLDLYKATGNVTLSAHGAGTARTNVYARRRDNAEFAERMDDAHQEAIERLEAEAWARARKTSDTLLIFLLKALKPDMYRENIKITLEYGLTADTINKLAHAIDDAGDDVSQTFNELIAEYAKQHSRTSSES